MARIANVTVTEVTLAALSALEEYRHLTVNQIATMCCLRPKSASEMLLRLERQGLLGHFGNVGIRGYGKTPKVYFLKKRGHSILAEETRAIGQTVEHFRPINVSTRWSPIMYHRLATLDVLSFVERDCRDLAEYDLLGTLVEYRREKVGSRWRSETTDYVTSSTASEDRIVPDAGFALRHRANGKQALFLIEVDLGSTRLTTQQSGVAAYIDKLALYDRYLASGRVKNRYPQFGSFSGFHLLTVTTSDQRISNMRNAAASLAKDFHQFHRFSTLQSVSQKFLHDGWLSRDHADLNTYSLIKGS